MYAFLASLEKIRWPGNTDWNGAAAAPCSPIFTALALPWH